MKSSKKFSDEFGCKMAKKQARKETSMTQEQIDRIRDIALARQITDEDACLLQEAADFLETVSADAAQYFTQF